MLYTTAKSILPMQNLGNDVSFGMKMVSTVERYEKRVKSGINEEIEIILANCKCLILRNILFDIDNIVTMNRSIFPSINHLSIDEQSS